MERWERVVDGAKDVCELAREGALITERAGREGATPVTREHHCDTEATAEGIRRRMAAQRERQGYARVGDDVAKEAAKDVGGASARPGYPGLSDETLDAVILRVGKAAAGDAYKVGEAIYKTTGDFAGRYGVAWFLVAQGLVPAETMPGLWDLLAEDHAHVDPAAVLSLLSRLPTGKAFTRLFKYDPMPWFVAGFTRALDELLFAAWQRDPSLFEARGSELVEPARRSLDFVRGRSGVALPPARAHSLLVEFAHAQATSGLATNWELARVEGGAVTRPRISDPAAVRAVALLFGTEQEWGAAMVAAALKVQRPSLSNVRDALGALHRPRARHAAVAARLLRQQPRARPGAAAPRAGALRRPGGAALRRRGPARRRPPRPRGLRDVRGGRRGPLRRAGTRRARFARPAAALRVPLRGLSREHPALRTRPQGVVCRGGARHGRALARRGVHLRQGPRRAARLARRRDARALLRQGHRQRLPRARGGRPLRGRRAAAPRPHLGAHAARASAHPAPAGARRPRHRGRPGRGRRPLVGSPRGLRRGGRRAAQVLGPLVREGERAGADGPEPRASPGGAAALRGEAGVPRAGPRVGAHPRRRRPRGGDGGLPAATLGERAGRHGAGAEGAGRSRRGGAAALPGTSRATRPSWPC
ncbi:MAG: hypothetical protein IPF99_26740 [Deltaproteobacteria bacterium]|nr:hypothetical protein [Deltaproteobacteria bacterium]